MIGLHQYSVSNPTWGFEIGLPFVGNYRTFLMTSGMPTEFSNLWALSRSYANSVY